MIRIALFAATALLVSAGCSSPPPGDAPASEKAVTAPPVEAMAESAPAAIPDMAALCTDFGPQTPRDISSVEGSNAASFPMAPAYKEMNLCNMHTHTNAEHKGPGFSVLVNDTENGGYACNDTATLTASELAAPTVNDGAFKGVKPGDSIEVHWVYSSCNIQPGEGLGSCLSDACSDPLLRVEAQTFLVVNDSAALNFKNFDYTGAAVDGRYQARSLPTDTGTPIVFRGSTTGPSYTQSTCSPLKVTWSVRPQCAKLDINSLNAWAADGNVFKETKSHGVRQLVTEPALLSPIE